MSEAKLPLVYLAGPFFNPAQQAGIQLLEKAVEDCGFKAFSPSRDGTVCPPDGTPEVRQQAFKQNAEKIDECALMVAWLDWLLPPGQHVRVLQGMQPGIQVQLPPNIKALMDAGAKVMGAPDALKQKQAILLPGQVPAAQGVPDSISIGLQPPTMLTNVLSPPLNLPDTGTVWEIGYSFKSDVPVFTVSMVPGRTNLMLTESAVCHSNTLEQLQTRLKKFLPVALQPTTQEYVEVVSALRLEGQFKGEVQ